VLEVGTIKVDDAMAAVRPYTSVDNEMGYIADGPALLASPPVLHAIGAAADETGAELLVLRAGAASPERVRVAAVDLPPGPAGALVPSYTYLHDKSGDGERPMFLRDSGQRNWIAEMPEHKAVYFRFWTVTDTREGTLREFADRVFNAIERLGAEHLILDMRFNGGGNTYLVRPLLYGLVGSGAVNRRGHLWVITGRNTFSAAQNTVNFLDIHTEAVFVGEPTGSSPCFVGESTSFVLPHSRTRVFCSSRYWQQMDSTDERTWVQPDIAARMSFEAYAAGRDPAMEAILGWIRPPAGSSATEQK
jgi:hypothetical protein